VSGGAILLAAQNTGTEPVSGELKIINRQKTRAVNMPLLRKIVSHLLVELLRETEFDISVVLLGEKAMARLNEAALQHAGSTDVITFDYSGAPPLPHLAGEVNVCIAEAVIQSRRFDTNWQTEMVRYIVHGFLHLRGHDDHESAARRLMKREENRLVRAISRGFDLSKLASKPTLRA
jgi:rRNA maturation RNase YbeY